MYPTFSRSLRHAALNWPHRPAVWCGDRLLTYAALDRAVDRFVAVLDANGLQRGDRVAVLLHNCPEYLMVTAAAARMGLVMVPVNFRLAPPEIAYILCDCKASRVIFSLPYRENLAAALAEGVPLRRRDCLLVGGGGADGWGACPVAAAAGDQTGSPPGVPEGSASRPDADLAWDDDFLIIYTSGTTGRPKGAVLTHGSRMLWILGLGLEYEIRRSDVFLAVMPWHHSAGITFAMAHLHAGATVVIHERFSPEAVWDAVARHGVTTGLFVPTMLYRLLERPGQPGSLRTVISCGSTLPVPVKQQVIETWKVRLYEYYGATESPNVSTLRPEDQLRKPGSVGQPFYNVEVRIVDEQGRDLPPGTVGEIWVRNPSLMRGYYCRPEETAAAIKDGWYATGDLGYLDEERFLYLAGRKKEVIISGGSNIYPAEVEAALAEHPAVGDIAVIGMPDPEWGEVPLAVVVLREGHRATAEELIAFCRTRLAGYKRPRRVVFAPELPRNAAGKVIRRLLAERLAGTEGGR